LEREQEGRRKIEKEGRRRSAEAGTENKLATTPSVAKEATIASAGDNGACSDGGSGKDKCSSTERTGNRARGRGSSKTGSLCNGGR